MTFPLQISRLFLIGLSAGLLFIQAGCGGGDDGPQRYHVSGKVTFDGQPVPYGIIVFNPDAKKNNSGPQGIATIKNGVYDTASEDGKGVVGGPMVIDVMGATSNDISEGGTAKTLFSSYITMEELPKETTTLDIAVPKEAAGKAKKK